MHVQVTLTKPGYILAPGGRKVSDKAYLNFCEANRDLQVERTPEGQIVVMPPAGFESEDRNMEVVTQLRTWANKDGRGRVTGPTSQFFLPDGSALSPDAAWTSNRLLKRATPEEKRRFPYLCPEFIVEVRSPSDRLNTAQALGKAQVKMESWIANGARLAWLIDGDRKTVHVYQPGKPVEIRTGILRIAGKGPVRGFVLQLRTIWEGLK